MYTKILNVYKYTYIQKLANILLNINWRIYQLSPKDKKMIDYYDISSTVRKSRFYTDELYKNLLFICQLKAYDTNDK